jgi:hypothetical protein
VSVVFDESSVCMFSMFYIRFMGKFYHSCGYSTITVLFKLFIVFCLCMIDADVHALDL